MKRVIEKNRISITHPIIELRHSGKFLWDGGRNPEYAASLDLLPELQQQFIGCADRSGIIVGDSVIDGCDCLLAHDINFGV